jgi:hypothetical protein
MLGVIFVPVAYSYVLSKKQQQTEKGVIEDKIENPED